MPGSPVLGGPGNPFSVQVGGGHIGIDPASPFLDPSQYKVNVPATIEQITQPLYSYQLYPAAGSTQLSFFTTQVGGSTTYQDTNMALAGQLPTPQMFLIQGIGIDYLPGTTAAAPVQVGAPSANGWTLDFYTIFRTGYLSLNIGTKNYLTQGPLNFFPPRSHFRASNAASDTTTAASAHQWKTDIAYTEGAVFLPTPLLLESGQNFNVTLNWATAVATVSTDALARIGVIMYGTLFRPAQ